jgi:lipopolysaccharide/colanic/teichoic acid biosynthesis glycosyltransferase
MNSRDPNLYSVVITIIVYCLTIISITLLIPVILILAIVIKLSGKGPVIYTQERTGKDGKPFAIYKFRSMHTGTEVGVQLLSDKNDNRITSVGRFMRKHKLDEIPNLVNVLKGEMSIVGPRPEQQYYVDLILAKAPEYKLLQSIKPGITSWGQVRYGYASTVEEMIERLVYDLYYYEKRSLWFDLKIIYFTFGIIIKGKGI